MTLPTTAVYGVAACVALGTVAKGMWVQAILLALSTLMMVELNNSCVLIRIYSRMVSCSFLVLTLMASFLFPATEIGVFTLAFITFYVFFLRAYRNREAIAPIYTAFLALGIASIPYVGIFYFVPLFWLLMVIRLQAFSVKTFFASLLGLVTPYWFIAGYYVYVADYETPLRHFQELTDVELQTIIHFPIAQNQLITLLFVVGLTITGISHFLRQGYMDKLRTQMIYELFMAVTLFTAVLLVLQSQHFGFLLSILIIHAAIFIGHFIALTRTKTTNIAFIAILVLTLALTVYNFLCQ